MCCGRNNNNNNKRNKTIPRNTQFESTDRRVTENRFFIPKFDFFFNSTAKNNTQTHTQRNNKQIWCARKKCSF